MISKRVCFFTGLVICAAFSGFAANPAQPYSGTRYATDAYPGFDREDEIVATGKKTPRLFSWLNGPKKDTAAEQFAWANACAAEGSWSAARRAYDALVREWPSAPEAPKAQEALANLLLEHDLNYEAAFEEYKYLLDFYSSDCDYDAIAYRLYETARLMREEGKTLLFFRFANTVDVRRAFEAVVLRAPGAKYAPAAMLTIGDLREDEGEWERAVRVYENLRNLYASAPEAKMALSAEARARMVVLREHPYNRSRCSDTVAFLKSALTTDLDADSRSDIGAWVAEAEGLLEDEAYAAAKFYDSRTRTRRSAINAYERFLADYPTSRYADVARARLKELQQESK